MAKEKAQNQSTYSADNIQVLKGLAPPPGLRNR